MILLPWGQFWDDITIGTILPMGVILLMGMILLF